MKQITWVIFGWFTLLTSAQAASFDCRKAASDVEKLICGDHVLSKYDEKLNFAYKVVLAEGDKPDATRVAQKQWIMERNKCSDVNCLRRKYTSQIRLLEKAIYNQPVRANKFDADACQMVSDYSSHNTLKSLFVRPLAISHPTKDEINKIFDSDFYGDVSYWSIDLNDDGIADQFVIDVDGTAHVSTGRVLSGENGSAVTTIDDSQDNNIDLDLLIVNKQYYVLSSYENNLGKLWRMGLDGYFHAVCKYSRRSEPLIEITKGKDNPVCNAASTGNVKHIDFKPVENKTVLNNEVVTGLATADVDNDGKPESISLVHYESGAGRGNSSLMIRVIDNGNPQHAIDINKMLESFDGYNVRQGVFAYGDFTYFDEASSGVILIKNGKAEEICNWKVRPLFDVQR